MMAGTAGAIRAGRAFVELFADDKKLAAGLEGARRRLARFGASVSQVGRSVMLVGTAMMAPIIGAVRQFMVAGDALAKGARRIGATAEEYAGLSYAADLAGSSIEDVEKAAKALTSVVYDAGAGLSTAKRALADVGLSFEDMAGLPITEQFVKVIDALKGVESEDRRLALAQDLLGRSGMNLASMIEAGGEALRANADEGRRLTNITNAQAAAAEVLSDAWTKAKTALSGAAMQAGAALAPALTEVWNRLADVTVEWGRWIGQHPEVVLSYVKVAAEVLAVGLALTALGKIITATTAIWGLLAAHPIAALFVAAGVAIGAALVKLRQWNAESAKILTLNVDERMNLAALNTQLRLRQANRKRLAEEIQKFRMYDKYSGQEKTIMRKEFEAEEKAIAELVKRIQEAEAKAAELRKDVVEIGALGGEPGKPATPELNASPFEPVFEELTDEVISGLNAPAFEPAAANEVISGLFGIAAAASGVADEIAAIDESKLWWMADAAWDAGDAMRALEEEQWLAGERATEMAGKVQAAVTPVTVSEVMGTFSAAALGRMAYGSASVAERTAKATEASAAALARIEQEMGDQGLAAE